jgi:hypothetical protein
MTYKEAEKCSIRFPENWMCAESSSKEEMKPLEIGIRAAAFGATGLYGLKKKNWMPFLLVSAFHITEYLVDKTSDRR